MTRIALKGPTVRPDGRRARGIRADIIHAAGLHRDRLIAVGVQGAALVSSAVMVVANAPTQVAGRPELAALVSATCFAILRVLTVRKRLAQTTIALDAVGTVVLLVGTGAPLSPFLPMALAGIWWAANLPTQAAARISGLSMAAACLALVVPSSLAAGLAGEALGKTLLLLVAGIAADRLVRAEQPSPPPLNPLLAIPPVDADSQSIREGLARAVGTTIVPVDALVATGRAGLTAIQTELLAYLMLGLANMEIADAIGLSEATVRYRLTGLYKALGVHGRKAAAARGRELGIDRILPSTTGR